MEKQIISNDEAKVNVVILTDPRTGERIKGMSKCHAEDSYDKELGIKIANGRAWKNYYKFVRKTRKQWADCAKSIIKIYDEELNEYMAEIQNAENKIADIQKSLEDLGCERDA